MLNVSTRIVRGFALTKKAAFVLIVLPVIFYIVGIVLFFILTEDIIDLDFFLYEGSDTGSAFGILVILLTFSIMTVGIVLTLKLIGVKLEALTGAFSNILPLAFKSFVIAFLVAAFGWLLDVPFNGGLTRNIEFVPWLAYLLPLLVAIFIQISAEELFFRGALPVALARLMPGRLLINILISVLFGIAHYEPGIYGEFGAQLVVLDIAVMSFLLLDLTFRAQSIGPALGWHFANNVFIFLFVGARDDALSHSLFVLDATTEEIAATPQAHVILILTYLITYFAIRISVLRR